MNNSDVRLCEIVLAVLPDGSFGGAGGANKKNDVSLIAQGLESVGYSVTVISITELSNSDLSQGSIVVYTSSDEPSIRKYIIDVIRIKEKKHELIPSFDALLAHENKGFQELVRSELGFGNLAGRYVFDYNDLPDQFPYIYKSVIGAGSKNVHLILSSRDKKKIWKKYFRNKFFRRVILFFRRLQYSRVEYENYRYRHRGYSLGVVQAFVPNLPGDHKILVFGSRYYVLHRKTRPNDFRASGSGVLSFDSVDSQLLDYAEHIFTKLNEPFASLDVGQSDNGFHLIEYQVLNFGPYAVKNSPGHYYRDIYSGDWVFQSGGAVIENEFARAINEYIQSRHNCT